jgi:hypothetical protein
MLIILFGMLLSKNANARSYSISGKVIDESGKMTAEDGSFKLAVTVQQCPTIREYFTDPFYTVVEWN